MTLMPRAIARTAVVAVGLTAMGLAATATAAAAPAGSPPANSSSHLNIPISGTCAGQPVTIVAGDSAHATAQLVDGGSGHLLPVSFTFVFADGSEITEVVAPHNRQPTVECTMAGVGGDGAPTSVRLVVVWKP